MNVQKQIRREMYSVAACVAVFFVGGLAVTSGACALVVAACHVEKPKGPPVVPPPAEWKAEQPRALQVETHD